MPRGTHPGMFLQQISNYRPLYGGVSPRPSQAFDFTSFLGDGPASAAGTMLAQPLLTQLMGGVGMVPGQFQPTMNMVDRLQAQQFFQQQQQSMAQASLADRFQQQRMMTGMFHMMGIDVGPEQRRFIQQVTEQIQTIAPLMASIAPDFYDQLSGLRGSATVMAQQMHLGGRHLLDPVTGQLGMRGPSAGIMARDVFNELYGPGRDISLMNGLGAGRAGQMFDELARRGHIGSLTQDEILGGLQRELGLGSRRDLMRHFAERAGVSEDQALETPEMQTAMRSFDTRRVSGRLREMSGAVAAMRDIFGDMGHPNAPMAELINGLQALTQGGLSTMSGPQLEMTVRRAANLARTSGMGMDGMMQLMAAGGQRAGEMGLDRQFGIIASLGATAFGQAFRAVGGGEHAAFGRMDAEAMTLMDQNLRLNAAASPMANMLGAAARMTSEGMAAPGSDMHRMLEAVRAGRTSFTNAAGESVRISDLASDPARFIEMATRAGVNPGIVGQILGATSSNQEYVANEAFGISDFVRSAQGEADVNPLIASGATTALTPVLQARGFNEAEISGMTPRLSDVVTRTLRNMNPRDRDNPARRNMLLAQAMRTEMGEEAYARLGGSDAERMASLLQISGATITNIDELITSDPALASYRNHRNLLDLHSERTLAEADASGRDATFQAQMQSAMAGLGTGGPLRRLAEAIGNATPETDMGRLLAEFFGGVPQERINTALGPLARRLHEEQTRLRDMAEGRGEFAGMTPEMRRRQLEDQTRRIRELLGGRNQEQLLEIAREQGITGPDADRELVRRVVAGEITDPALVDRVREHAGMTLMADAGLGVVDTPVAPPTGPGAAAAPGVGAAGGATGPPGVATGPRPPGAATGPRPPGVGGVPPEIMVHHPPGEGEPGLPGIDGMPPEIMVHHPPGAVDPGAAGPDTPRTAASVRIDTPQVLLHTARMASGGPTAEPAVIRDEAYVSSLLMGHEGRPAVDSLIIPEHFPSDRPPPELTLYWPRPAVDPAHLLPERGPVGMDDLRRPLEGVPAEVMIDGPIRRDAERTAREERGPITINGTLTVRADGTGELVGTAHRGGALPPGGS